VGGALENEQKAASVGRGREQTYKKRLLAASLDAVNHYKGVQAGRRKGTVKCPPTETLRAERCRSQTEKIIAREKESHHDDRGKEPTPPRGSFTERRKSPPRWGGWNGALK